MQRRVAGHPTRVAQAGEPLRQVLDLHAPVEQPNDSLTPYRCDGCDATGWEVDATAWPCRTYQAIAGWSE